MSRPALKLQVQALAARRGYSAAELARRAGLAESSVRRYWRDPGAHIRTDTLAILAHTLGVSPWRCSMMSRRATQRRYRASGSRMLIDEIARATGRQIRLVARKRGGEQMFIAGSQPDNRLIYYGKRRTPTNEKRQPHKKGQG